MFSAVSSAGSWNESISDDKSQGSWKESNSDDLPFSLLWWSWNESLALISNLVKCHCLSRVLKWVSVSQCAHFYWALLPKGLKKSQFVLLHCLLPWFQLSYPFCTLIYCCTCSFSASALAAWGMLSWTPWWTLFCWAPLRISSLSMGVTLGCLVLMGFMMDSPLLHSMGIFPLSMGISLDCWGSLGLSVCLLSGSVLLGLDLLGHAHLACYESFSLSMADFLSEMKLNCLLVLCHNVLF